MHPTIGHLRAARRPSRPQSGPLRAFHTQGCTPRVPPKPVRRRSTPVPGAAGSTRFATPAPVCHLEHQSEAGAPLATWPSPSAAPRRCAPCASPHPRFRGRDAGCPAPPAQIRTCALTHTAPTFGSDRGPRGDRRIRSTACVTVPRLGVRPVLWPRGFPSVTGLGSSNSAAARYRLVRCLHRYYAGVRLLRAFHHRLTASRLPDAVPPVAR